MSETIFFAISAMVGVGLGIIFYGGLWWTVRRSVVEPHWAPWIVVSFLMRALIVIGGFYWVLRGNLLRLLFCLLGFMVARILVTRFVNSTGPKHGHKKGGNNYAHHA